MAKKSLTRRQQQVLDFILSEMHKKGYPPSVREIGQFLRLSSSATIHSHLKALEKKGYLRRDPTKPRALEILNFRDTEIPLPSTRMRSVPVVGKIAAGTPLLAQENIEDTFPLPPSLGPENTFILKVKGSSMIGAGIFDGDYLVVKREAPVQNGDIVVAILEGFEKEATVKRFFREKRGIRLVPENPKMEPIRLSSTEGVTIIGKAFALLRKL